MLPVLHIHCPNVNTILLSIVVCCTAKVTSLSFEYCTVENCTNTFMASFNNADIQMLYHSAINGQRETIELLHCLCELCELCSSCRPANLPSNKHIDIHTIESCCYSTCGDTRPNTSQSNSHNSNRESTDGVGRSNRTANSHNSPDNTGHKHSGADDNSDHCEQSILAGNTLREGIKIVHWNCQGANGKLATIKDAVQKDGIHILLLQDTRLSRRGDGLPKLRMDGYSTYDTPKSENSHGMMILVHKDIPSSELATQFKFGHHTESLSIRIWVNGSSYILHNIYNNGNTVNFSAAPSNEKSLFLGDFNAHHTSWCRAAQNRAGINISEQLDDMDHICYDEHGK